MSRLRRTLLLNVAGAAAFLLAARIGYLCALPEEQAGFIWPPTGIAVALVFLFGSRVLPGIAAASALGNLVAGSSLAFALMAMAGDVVQSALAVWLLRSARFQPDLARTRDVVSFVGFASCLAMMAGATIGVTAMRVGDVPAAASVSSLWWVWCVANGMGVLVVTPLVLAWMPGASQPPLRTHPAELMATLGVVTVVAALVFLGLVGRYAQFSLLFITFPALLWMGLRQPLRWTTVAILVTAGFAVAGTVNLLGPFAPAGLAVRLVILWGYVGTITTMALLLGAAVTEARAEAESRSRLAAIVDATTDFVGTATPEGHVLSVNPAGRRLVGLSEGAPIAALRMLDFHPQWARDLVSREGIPTAVRKGVWAGDTALVAGDGREIPVSHVLLAHADAGGGPAYISTIMRDISERLRTEEALREREANLRLIFDVAPIGIVLVDGGGRLLRWNAAFQRMLGYAEEELRTGTLDDFTVPEDAAAGRDVLASFAAQGADHAQIEKRYRRRDGSEVWARVFASAVRDDHGVFQHTVSLVEDITDRRRLEEELLQAQKMESIGRLAGGVAHDFNNLLTAILGYLDLADGAAADEAQVRECLGPIRASAERAGQLTRQLLAFARKQMIAPRIVDMRLLVANVQQLLHRLLGEDIDLRTEAALDLWPVRVDPGQFEQVVLNLAVNARDAMPRGGRMVIATRNVVLADADARALPDVAPGSYVLLSVEDEGTGMTEDVQKRVFDPFFTTKGPGLGTGLGLSMVHGTVKQHGGHIAILSAPNQGTTVSIYIPRAAGDFPPVVDVPVQEVARGDETLLLVEDEPLVRDMAAASLRHAGYHVLSAASGEAALATSSDHNGTIDLLLTDVVMPQMSGPELADRLVRLRPGIRVLYTSGYTQDLLATRGVGASSVAFLQKPYSPAALARQVRQALDA